jgi:lysozyme
VKFKRLVDDLLVDEAIRLKPYKDNLGFWTIGVGNRYILGEEVTENTPPLKNAQVALELCYSDIFQACMDAQSYYPDIGRLRDDRQEVLVNMAFQMGLSKLSKFVGLRKALEVSDYVAAGSHMRNSLWFRQTPNRCEKYAKIMESPIERV